MKFEPFVFVIEEPTGQKDKLGNAAVEKTDSDIFQGRFTEWTADEVTILGREMTAGTRKLIYRGLAPKNAKSVRIEGATYAIKSTRKLGRWGLAVLKGFRL